MAIFPSMLITKQGQTLYNKAQAGVPINFTKMKIGSGRLSDGQDQTVLAGLIDYKFDIPISSITQNTQLQIAVISGRITNENITTGTYICELGLFAQDPDVGEILYAYTNAADQGDYYAPASRGPFTWAYQINAAVGNAANVTATLVSNSTFDYAIDVSSNFKTIVGTNQQEVNESVDKQITSSNLALEESTGYGVISGLSVSAQSTPNMTVNIASGIVHMANGIRLAAIGNSNLAITAADSTNPRIDIVYVKNDSTIGYTSGTPSGTPTAPDTPSGAFLLAQINVAANATTITNDIIIDKRKIKLTTENLTQTVTSHLADNVYQTAGGTATVITLTINGTLVNGYPMTFIASANNNGSATTINNKKLYKPNTTTAPNLIAGKAYTIWYSTSGDSGNGCFFIKASAEGTAIAGNVLAVTTFSNDSDTGIVGTMPNNGAVTIIPSSLVQSIPVGYHNGSGTVSAVPSTTYKKYAKGTWTGNGTGTCTVSGLTFTPSIILTENTSGGTVYNSIYCIKNNLDNINDVFCKAANLNINGSAVIQANGSVSSYVTVNSSGFSIAVTCNGGTTLNWIAVE